MKLSLGVGCVRGVLVLIGTLTTMGLAGCGKSTKADGEATTSAATIAKDGRKGACNLRKEASTCSEETDKSDPMGLAKGLCDALKGTWSEGGCPKDNVVGTCTDKDGSVTSYYGDGAAPRDLDDAKSSCETINEGTFTAIATPKAQAAASASAAVTAVAATPKPKAGGKPAKK